MGIYIKGMEMPKNCTECRFCVDGWCYVCKPQSDKERKRIATNYCPLVSVPPHGRLIDADALVYNIGDAPYKGSVRRVLLSTPTIIEAEEDKT